MKFNYRDISAEIVYSKRKTISLEVNINGEVKIRAPKGVKISFLESILEKKYNWIISKRKELLEKSNKKIVHNYKEGERYLYLGKYYELKIIKDSIYRDSLVFIENDKLIIKTDLNSQENIREILEQWYRKMTYELAIMRVNYYKKYFSKYPTAIKSKEQKKRWGSCTYDNKLLFNWRCSMAPLEIFDYIVVHEMCHMSIKNHSKLFWDDVERVLPSYKSSHSWLKENGILLEL